MPMDPSLRWPLVSNIIRRGAVSNTFGMVRHNADGSKRAHQGWDFFAPSGTPCFAIANGEVAHIGRSGAYGNLVVHSFVVGGQTRYAAFAHLSRVDVALGQAVQRGARIGLCGTSGNANGMTGIDQHLHFEIRTQVTPGLGLAGRVSPLEIFRQVPLDGVVSDPV